MANMIGACGCGDIGPQDKVRRQLSALWPRDQAAEGAAGPNQRRGNMSAQASAAVHHIFAALSYDGAVGGRSRQGR
jgi:hypothetical protein